MTESSAHESMLKVTTYTALVQGELKQPAILLRHRGRLLIDPISDLLK